MIVCSKMRSVAQMRLIYYSFSVTEIERCYATDTQQHTFELIYAWCWCWVLCQ